MSSPIVLARHPFRSVLVATDFSEHAEAAIRRACRLRLAPDARLHVLHVDDRSGASPEDLSAYLESHATLGREPSESPVPVVPSLVQGEPATEIDLLARLADAELVLVGRQGRGGRIDLGSTARALLDIADRPVLVVGHPERAAGYSRVLVALDLQLVSADILVLASRLVEESGTDVVVMHAFEANLEGTRGLAGRELNTWGERFQERAQARLEEIVNSLPESRIAWRAMAVLGDAAPAVAAEAKSRGADLVVVGTERRRGISGLLFRSVAMQVLESVDCDCLVLPTPGQERAFPPRPSGPSSQS